MFLRCNSYLRAVLMFLALQQLLKEEESYKEDKEGGKSGKDEEDKREISCTRIDESPLLPRAYC